VVQPEGFSKLTKIVAIENKYFKQLALNKGFDSKIMPASSGSNALLRNESSFGMVLGSSLPLIHSRDKRQYRLF
jgi:hypothetical protein